MHKTIRTTLGLASTAFALAVSGSAAFAAPLPTGWTSTGSSGTNTAVDGDVTLAPGFNSYQWISTVNGQAGIGRPSTGFTGEETNGSYAQTPAFSVNAGTINSIFTSTTSLPTAEALPITLGQVCFRMSAYLTPIYLRQEPRPQVIPYRDSVCLDSVAA